MSAGVTSPIGLKSSDRGILIGASRTGKSTLANELLRLFHVEYPGCRRLILDTKPRWRAARLPTGQTTRRYYRDFVKGDTVEGSMLLKDPRDWQLVWDQDVNPAQAVVVQNHNLSDRANMQLQLWAAEKFFRSVKADVPSLIYFDEGMDFFNVSGGAVGHSDIVQRCFRAGGEKGLTSLVGVQRPKGINPQLLTETSWCALFRIQFTEDVKRLWEMGWPRDAPVPTFDQPHAFRLWKGAPEAPLYRLAA